jgi:cysteine desulfurase
MPNKPIYFDHNATTPLHPEVKKTISKAMDIFGNPSSLHSFGRHAKERVESARYQTASFLGAQKDSVIFMGSGSEANNTVLSMFACESEACSYKNKGKTRIVTTTIEHPCVLETSKCLCDRGKNVSYIDVDQYGKIDLNRLNNLISEDTGLVSVMTANNEIGTIQDIKAICDIVHKKGALFHTDAVQAVGKIPIDVVEIGVDFLTLSGHKMYAPKGIGALYVKKGVPFCPLIRGGHQERNRRAGTENTLGIIALGKAIEMRKKEMEEEEERLKRFKTMLKESIESEVKDIMFNGHPTDSLANTLNVSFYGAEGEAILLYLDAEGIAVSTGSACASGSLDPSHVLLATGLDAEHAHGSIRISMGRGTTEQDIDYLIKTLPKVIDKVRSMSTAYTGGKR